MCRARKGHPLVGAEKTLGVGVFLVAVVGGAVEARRWFLVGGPVVGFLDTGLRVGGGRGRSACGRNRGVAAAAGSEERKKPPLPIARYVCAAREQSAGGSVRWVDNERGGDWGHLVLGSFVVAVLVWDVSVPTRQNYRTHQGVGCLALSVYLGANDTFLRQRSYPPPPPPPE